MVTSPYIRKKNSRVGRKTPNKQTNKHLRCYWAYAMRSYSQLLESAAVQPADGRLKSESSL